MKEKVKIFFRGRVSRPHSICKCVKGRSALSLNENRFLQMQNSWFPPKKHRLLARSTLRKNI